VFAAAIGRRSICVAHGFPYPDLQGWAKVFGFIGSYKLTNHCSQARLVAVSDYLAIHLKRVYNVRVDAVIHNPISPIFQEAFDASTQERNLITYVGRIVPSKNLDRLLPPICDLLEENASLRACIIGEGESRPGLEKLVGGNPQIEFTGALGSRDVRNRLRRTRLLVSGSAVEPLGISYIEALTQGCVVAMPACGGGLELGLDQIAKQIQLLPISLDRQEVLVVLRRAILEKCRQLPMDACSAKSVAATYLRVDSLRFPMSQQTMVTEPSSASTD
jgi:glycosyltransferase involved in cell wall biosynthesis